MMEQQQRLLKRSTSSEDIPKHAIYGRQEEIQTLLHLHDQICSKQGGDTNTGSFCTEIALIRGASGVGKTALVEEFKSSIINKQESNVYFVSGKFDQYQFFSAPYSAIVQAFDSIGECLLRDQQNATSQDEQSILDESFDKFLESEGSILVQLIPSLSKLLDVIRQQHEEKCPSSSSSSQSSEELTLQFASERLAVAFRSFLRMICQNQPLVLFVDDLQWTDQNSLDILAAIVEDREIQHFLFIGGYRSDGEHELEPFLERVRKSKQHLTDIPIENLDMPCLEALITDVVPSINNERTKHQLLNVVFQKTEGNPYFIFQFLKILKQQGLLRLKATNGKWSWDMEHIETAIDATESVMYGVTKRIQGLSPDIRRILKLASCLGFAVDRTLLETLDRLEVVSQQDTKTQIAAKSIHSAFERALSQAEAEDLIVQTGLTCKFSHDKVQECVYELIPKGKTRDAMHFRCGKHIVDLYNQTGDQDLLFIAADQCNRGLASIDDNYNDERLRLVRLNLEASRAARKRAGIALVAGFLDKAIELTRESDWKGSSYGLILEVFSVSAEVESARGKFDRSHRRVESILNRAETPQDTIRAITVQAESLGAQQNYGAALVEAKRALSLLGVKMPASNRVSLMIEIYKTRRKLKQKTAEDLLNLDLMVDNRVMQALKILRLGVIWGWNADTYFGLLSYLTMVQLSLEYGRSNLMPFALAGYGNIIADVLGKEEEAYEYGCIATKMNVDKRTFSSTVMVVNCYLLHLRQPVNSCLENNLRSYRVSLETGDVGMGAICLCNYIWLYKFCGMPLGPIASDMRSYLAELKICQQEFLLAFLLPDLQFTLNLIGETEDPLTISWNVIQESHLFTYQSEGAQQHPAELNRIYTQMLLSIVLRDVELTEDCLHQMLSRRKRFQKYDGSHISNQFFIFLDGLASIELLRKGKSRNFRRVANQSIKLLTRRSKNGSVNCVGMLQLLNAEMASLRPDVSVTTVKKMYTNAITQLSKTGFLHFSAIANERIGELMLDHDRFWGEHYLSRSATLYQEWGALVKVKQLLEKYSFITLGEDTIESVRFAVHGRSRYNSLVDSFDGVSGEDIGESSGNFSDDGGSYPRSDKEG